VILSSFATSMLRIDNAILDYTRLSEQNKKEIADNSHRRPKGLEMSWLSSVIRSRPKDLANPIR
jgi:hypothetical protein